MAQPDVNVKGFTLAQKMVGRACGVDGVVPGASRSLFRSFGVLGLVLNLFKLLACMAKRSFCIIVVIYSKFPIKNPGLLRAPHGDGGLPGHHRAHDPR